MWHLKMCPKWENSCERQESGATIWSHNSESRQHFGEHLAEFDGI